MVKQLRRYYELDSLRGLAACSVILWHCFLMLNLGGLTSIIEYGPSRVLMAGNEAVILFFLLSGLVLALPFLNGLEITKRNYGYFVIKRITRIYLPYVVAISISIICYYVFYTQPNGNVSEWGNNLWKKSVPTQDIIQHFLFFGNYNHDFNVVIWSLIHELRISIIFPIVMIAILKLNWKINVSLGMFFYLVSGILYYAFGDAYLDYIKTIFYLNIFIFGALLAKHKELLIGYVSGLSAFKKILLIFVGFFLYLYMKPSFLINAFLPLSDFYRQIIDTIFVTIGAFIITIAALSMSRISNVLLRRPIKFLGEISYSLYLYHLAVMLTFLQIFNGVLNVGVILFLSVVVTLIIATASYYFVEIPCMKLGKRIVSFLGKFESEFKKVDVKKELKS